MAPEQFRGQAVLSTDLYGLGTTLLFLLTRKSPSELPQRKLKIDFRSHVRLDKEFANWLEKMLEPVIEDRFQSAKEALAVLRGEQALTSYSAQKPRRPKHSPVTLIDTEGTLVAEIPPVWLRSTHSRLFALVCLIWNGFFIWMTWAIAGIPNLPISIAGFLLLTRLIGLWLLGDFLFRAASSIQIRIDQHNFWLQRCLLGVCYRKVQGRTENVNQVKLSGISLPLNKKFLTVCVLRSKWRKHRFGSFLTQPEKEWLVGEIKAFLNRS